MNRAGWVLVLECGFLWLSACVHNAFLPTTTLRMPPRAEGCYLDIILQGEPPFPYVVIGRVTTDSTAPGLFALGENNEVAMERLRNEACQAGAHGLLHAGAESQGTWTGNGYSKSTTGAAVVFVYVDAAGNPLPPPTGPRLVIHPGSAMPPPAPPPPPDAPR